MPLNKWQRTFIKWPHGPPVHKLWPLFNSNSISSNAKIFFLSLSLNMFLGHMLFLALQRLSLSLSLSLSHALWTQNFIAFLLSKLAATIPDALTSQPRNGKSFGREKIHYILKLFVFGIKTHFIVIWSKAESALPVKRMECTMMEGGK